MIITKIYETEKLTFVLWHGYFAGLTLTQFNGDNVICHWRIKPKTLKP